MDFSLTPELEDIRVRTRRFVEEHVLPLEADRANFDDHENLRLDVLRGLQAKARAQGLWAPQAPKEYGGLALPIVGWAVMYEEANRSIFGPLAFNCQAPDDGNMNLLALTGTKAQKDKWLRPIVAGEARSSFAMTEPAPGGGSDPGMIRTRAEKKAGGWVIRGHKWFITGAGVADHFILIARTSDDARRGLTAFLYHRDQPGWRILRRIPIMGPEEHGGHCELAFEGLEVADEDVLMQVGDGLRATQIRLGPARLTHCMRWLGLARRALDIALDRAAEREAFGARLQDLGMVQAQIADAVIDLDSSRALVRQVAGVLDAGADGTLESSVAKVHVGEAVGRVVDRAAQVCGALGVSHDLPLARYMTEVRPFRIYDGPSEAHRWSIARRAVSRRRQQREGAP